MGIKRPLKRSFHYPEKTFFNLRKTLLHLATFNLEEIDKKIISQ